MMLLQFMVYGAIFPVMSLYWKNGLHLSGGEIGMIFSLASLSSLASPVIGAVVADRYIRAKYLLAFCNLLAAVFLVLLRFQTGFWPLFGAYLLYSLAIGPTMSLVNSICFHSLESSRGKFGNIRVWGTIGYIAVGWLFSFFWLKNGAESGRMGDAFLAAAIAAGVLGFYALSLPNNPLRPREQGESLIPKEVFKVLMRKEIWILALIQYGIFFIDRFYFMGTAPFLIKAGSADAECQHRIELVNPGPGFFGNLSVQKNGTGYKDKGESKTMDRQSGND